MTTVSANRIEQKRTSGSENTMIARSFRGTFAFTVSPEPCLSAPVFQMAPRPKDLARLFLREALRINPSISDNLSLEATLRKVLSLLLGSLIAIMATSSALADAPFVGKWSGQFNGVQIAFPPQQGPFGYLKDDSKKYSSEPKYTETPLTLDVTTEKNGLAAGTWKSGEFSQTFVCAQISPTMWNCVDAGGRASVELKSATQIKVCYLDNREGAQGAGCGLLQKSP